MESNLAVRPDRYAVYECTRSECTDWVTDWDDPADAAADALDRYESSGQSRWVWVVDTWGAGDVIIELLPRQEEETTT